MSLPQISNAIRRYSSFLVTSHRNMEGDALGAELAFASLVRALGKRAVIVNEDALPGELSFLPGAAGIKQLSRLNSLPRFDCFVALDCADMGRCGAVGRLAAAAKAVLNIDHHIGNPCFGTVNWVEPRASSASEMVYRLYKRMGVPIGKSAATALYVGILTDTGSFRYRSTSPETHLAAADLMRLGVDVYAAYRNVYEHIDSRDIPVLGRLLAGVRLEKGGRVAWMVMPRGTEGGNSSFDFSDYMLTLMRSITGTEAVAIFREPQEDGGPVRVNLRSQGKVDVNAVAKSFGGGGHKLASGCTLPGPLAAAKKKVLAMLGKGLR